MYTLALEIYYQFGDKIYYPLVLLWERQNTLTM
jgi:hypothetical protein